jgi:tRNA (guanine37-N1)-methyltransferase
MKKDQIAFIKIRKQWGNLLIKNLKNLNKDSQIINHRYKIEHLNNYILFPLINKSSIRCKILEEIKKQGLKFDIIYREPIVNKDYKYRSLKEALNKKIPKKYFEFIPQSYDVIGTIAIVEFSSPNGFSTEIPLAIKKTISEAITQVNKGVKTVYEKNSEIKGEYRLRKLRHLFGEKKTETLYKENHCKFRLDVQKTFFTPRLVFERCRVSNLTYQKEEIVADLFAGVGPFSIQIAKKHQVSIYAFDKNDTAIQYLKENINLNSLRGTIKAFNMDIRNLIHQNNSIGNQLSHTMDRIIMNLPEKSIDFIDIACYLLKPQGGIIHSYQFSEKERALQNALERLQSSLKKVHWKIEKVLSKKVVKPYSPKIDLVVLDVLVKRNKI